ncbi:MAG TPA: HlyD family secretion protein [Blastocatellia bacterium]|nr:HlyD family secretion protein [Blastocatellia bacterium]
MKITAPVSGTVASVATQEGETVAASFAAPTFITIIEDKALELVAMVDETDISNVHIGDPVTFTVETYPSRDLGGVVKRIAPKATIVSGVVNYEVGIEIGRKEISLLKPDMTANISIRQREQAGRKAPSSAAGKARG